MPPSSAKDMLMQVKRYADGGDVSSAGLAKAISSGLTQEQYDNNIRAYIAKTSNPLDALNAATENGVSRADINRALGTKAASDYFTIDYNTETAPSTNVATGFTSQIAEKYNAAGGEGLAALNKRIGEIGAQYADNTPENAQILRDIFMQERGSIADLQRAGFDPSRLLGTVAKKAPPKPQPPTGGEVSTGYQPLPTPPPIYAPGQQALNVPFRDSPVRTYDPRYGYTYTPAAQLLSATGSGMSWTPPSVTGRPRELLNVPLPVDTGKPWSQLTPTEKANLRLSSSQYSARELKAKQELDALNMAGGRFSGQQAPAPIDETENPNAVKPIDLRFYAPPPVGMQSGGPVKKPEGSSAQTAPMSHADLLAQIDRSMANSPAPATGTASSAPDREVTESQTMLRRLSDAFGQNVTVPVVGSMLDMTTGLGDLAQMGLKAGANKLGIETKPFTPVSSALQESLGVAGYDPYSPAALAASVLLPAAGPLRTAAAATRPVMSMAAAPGSAKQTLSLIKPILDREASVAASAELAAMGAREVAPDNVTAEIAAAIAGGAGYNTLDNILSSASRGPITSGIIKEGGGNWLGDSIDTEMESLRVKNQGPLFNTPASTLEAMYERYTPEAIASLSPEFARNVTNSIEGLKAKSQIDKWIDTKLGKYIRNEMATEGDPIRALAERGVLHYDPNLTRISPWRVNENRLKAGTQGLARSETAKAWEDASDVSVKFNTAGDLLKPSTSASEYLTESTQERMRQAFLDENPWLAKLAPETNVYDLSRTAGYERLGFEHLIDELNNATRPDTDLPERLRIDYNKLDRMSVPQIVEKVADINSWRVENMSKANQALANNAATHFDLQLGLGNKTYPETGLRWAQLRMPDGETDPTTLQAALKYEGDTMGHCVGGYCDDVADDITQIFSLRDAKGAPHVTIEVQETVNGISGDILNAMEPGIWDKIIADNGYHDAYRWLEKNRPDLLEKLNARPTHEIVQIKGKGNAAPAKKYLPAVQDFVRSRTWSDVGDLYNTGLVKIDTDSDLAKSLTQKGMVAPTYVTQEELTDLLNQTQGGYVTRKQTGGEITLPTQDPTKTESQNMLERFTSLNTPKDMSLGETAADIALGFAPGIGTAQGLRDFERARRDDDTLGMVLGAASALPIVGGAVKAARTIGKASKAADDLAALTAKAPTDVAPNLTRFLKNSQVKEPVFHAAKADVKEFLPKYRTELSSMGFHFGTADQANFRTNQYDFDSKSPNIGKYYLNIENPLEVSHMASFAPDHLAEKMMDMDLLTEDAYDALSAKHDYDTIATGDSLVKILKKNGYDGLKYKNEREGDGFSFVPFNPTQIKSAIGNEGTYDPTNPVITKAQGGYVTKKTKGAKP